jgi:protein-L-isoaspartate(D-aspartate) O-methyltransferase
MIILYELLELAEGHKLLEIGLGSGYSVVVAREIVGTKGLVVAIEIEHDTYITGKKFVEASGFDDIILKEGDGYLGYPEMSPYDRICITAACNDIPLPLIDQLKIGGKLIAPVIKEGKQEIELVEKLEKSITRKIIQDSIYNIPYVPFIGEHEKEKNSTE